MLEAGADENAARADGITALMAAAICGRLDMVQLLLEAGADINAARDGITALMAAAENDHLEVVELFHRERARMAYA